MNIRGRVEIVTYPERLVARLSAKQSGHRRNVRAERAERHAFMQRLVEQRGLRAQLRSGNLLTGQLFVAFDFFPNAPKAKIDWSREVPELPVVPSTVSDLEAKLTSIVAKLDKLPLEAIGADLTKALASLSQTLEGREQGRESHRRRRHAGVEVHTRRICAAPLPPSTECSITRTRP